MYKNIENNIKCARKYLKLTIEILRLIIEMLQLDFAKFNRTTSSHS